MITINLLPVESFRQTASGQVSVTVFSIAVLVACFGLYFFSTLVMDTQMEQLRVEQASTQAKLDDMKNQSSQAQVQTKNFTQELVQVSAISELEERRRDQTRLFSALAQEVLNQSSWLVSCSHANGSLAIRGMATDHDVVAQFLRRLENQPLLTKVELLSAAEDTVINGVRLVTFEIRALTLFPDATLMAGGLPDVNLPDINSISQLITKASPDLASFLERTSKSTTKTL